MERLTEYDLDIGYYVEEDMANQEATSNIDGRTVIQGEAITKLAELENMIEEGELVQVVRCMDCARWDSEVCYFLSTDELQYNSESHDFCSCGERRK